MLFLYRTGIRLYGWLIACLSLFNTKASLFYSGRKNWRTKLALQLSSVSPDNRVWFHCASLGEFEQARPIIEAIKSKYGHPVIVSFFSPSGYEIRKNYKHADVVCYLPLDTKTNARNFIDLLKPAKAYFVKYEFWYYYLNTLKKQQISSYLISAVFRHDQIFFKPYGKLFYRLLQGFDTIYVQNDSSLELLRSQGISNALKSGDTRFDRVMQTYRTSEENEAIQAFAGDSSILLLGSSWPEEEKITAAFIEKRGTDKLKLIIAPHDISESHIRNIETVFSAFKPLRYTDLPAKTGNTGTSVLILNTIGQLASAYRYADIAFVGGAFGKGLHNILEPAVFGMPVIFGPAPEKFPEAKTAEQAGFGFRINNEAEFEAVMQKLLSDHEFYEHCCKAAHQFIGSHTGATDMILSRYMKP